MNGIFRLTLFFALLILLVSCTEEPEMKPITPRVMSMQVADTSGLTERAFPGRARAEQEVNQSFRVSGQLIALPVNIGDEVKKGDMVARIDPQDYESALATVRGQLDRERARMARTQADLKRLENIYKTDPGATSEIAIDRAKQLYQSARASVSSIQATVKAAQNQIDYTTLEAPFDGVIVETYVENYETVIAKQPVVRLLNPSNIEFTISVPENLIGYVPFVKEVEVKFDALPDITVSASIKEVGKEASQATRTYPVTLVMQQPEGVEILSGMAGQAYIRSQLPDSADITGIEVPATAVFTEHDPSKSYVWIIDDASKTLSRREVETGRLSRYGVLIRSGLNPGDSIVIKGVHSLSEGQKVRKMDDKEKT